MIDLVIFLIDQGYTFTEAINLIGLQGEHDEK